MIKNFIFLVLLSLIFGHAQAGELTFMNVNPSFGGSPLNSNHLMSIANSINTYQAHSSPSSNSSSNKPPTSAELFAQQVDRLVMSALATRAVNQAFGNNNNSLPDESTINTGVNTVTVSHLIDGTHVTIVDNATGSQAVITVPNF